MKAKEFWEVEITSKKWKNSKFEFYVFATSAREAEARGLTLAKKKILEEKDDPAIWQPYCSYTKFIGYISL